MPRNYYNSIIITIFIIVIIIFITKFLIKNLKQQNNDYENLIIDENIYRENQYETNYTNELVDILNDYNAHKKIQSNKKIDKQILAVWNILDEFIKKNYITRAYSNEEILFSTKKGELDIMNNIVTNTGIINGNLLNESIRNIDGETDSEPVEFIYLDSERKISTICNKIDIIINLIKNNMGSIKDLDNEKLQKLRESLKKVTGCGNNCKCRCMGACFNPLQPYNNYFGQIRLQDKDDNHSNFHYSNENEKYISDYISELKPVKLLNSKKYANYQYPRNNTINAGGNSLLKKYPNTFNYEINSDVNQTANIDDKSDGEFYRQYDQLDQEILQKSYPYEQMLQGMKNKKEGFSSEKTNNQEFTNVNLDNNLVEKNSQVLKADLSAADATYDVEFGDTWTAFLRNNPEGWLKRRDIFPKDLLGYKFNGSFQKSLYDFGDSYRYKTLRCLQQKYRNLEDKNIFNQCMGWEE